MVLPTPTSDAMLAFIAFTGQLFVENAGVQVDAGNNVADTTLVATVVVLMEQVTLHL